MNKKLLAGGTLALLALGAWHRRSPLPRPYVAMDTEARAQYYLGHPLSPERKERSLQRASVKNIQRALGVKADGAFGEGTARALRAFQESKGLAPSGGVDPLTAAHLGLLRAPKKVF